jgi:hypothetical protein
MALVSVGTDMDRWRHKSGMSGELEVLERAWESEMGGWASMARAAAIDRSTLVVEVVNSVAMQEISLRRRELVRRLNRHFTNPFITEIKIRLAE